MGQQPATRRQDQQRSELGPRRPASNPQVPRLYCGPRCQLLPPAVPHLVPLEPDPEAMGDDLRHLSSGLGLMTSKNLLFKGIRPRRRRRPPRRIRRLRSRARKRLDSKQTKWLNAVMQKISEPNTTCNSALTHRNRFWHPLRGIRIGQADKPGPLS